MRCRTGEGRVRVRVTATRDPAIELDDAQRKADLFERAFRSELTLAWSRPGHAAERPAPAGRKGGAA